MRMAYCPLQPRMEFDGLSAPHTYAERAWRAPGTADSAVTGCLRMVRQPPDVCCDLRRNPDAHLGHDR
jgi:hypothetical protein